MTLLEFSQIVFYLTFSIFLITLNTVVITIGMAVVKGVNSMRELVEETRNNVVQMRTKLQETLSELSFASFIKAISHFLKKKRSTEK